MLAGLDALPAQRRASAELIFTTHSIPTAMAASAGPHGGAYEAQHLEVVRLVTDGVAAASGRTHAASLVYQSRSGPPSVPWLEPDIADHLRARAAAGLRAVVVAPIGFVSDHMEVRFDLDVEAARIAEDLDVSFVRAPTVGTAPEFVAAVHELVLERTEGAPRRALGLLGPSHDVCPGSCCPNLRAPKPVVAGVAS